MAHVLVLSPHPDDETLGCGGTICQHVAAGDRVRVVFLTSGERGGHGMSPDDTARRREAEAAAAAEILGVTDFEFWRAPDGKLKATPRLAVRLANLLRTWRPEMIYTTHAAEAHPDHRAAARILGRALALWGNPTTTTTICMFEVWTPLTRIDRINDVSPWMATKLRAVQAYESQCAAMRFDEAIAGLNRYRGEMHSWPGGDYAEVFAHPSP